MNKCLSLIFTLPFTLFFCGTSLAECLLTKPEIPKTRIPLVHSVADAGDAHAYVLMDEPASLLRLRVYWAEKDVWWEYTRQIPWHCEASVSGTTEEKPDAEGVYQYIWEISCLENSPNNVWLFTVAWNGPGDLRRRELPLMSFFGATLIGTGQPIQGWLLSGEEGPLPLAIPGERWKIDAESRWLPGFGQCWASGAESSGAYPSKENKYREKYGDEMPEISDKNGEPYTEKDFKVFNMTQVDGHLHGLTVVPVHDPKMGAEKHLRALIDNLSPRPGTCQTEDFKALAPVREALNAALGCLSGETPNAAAAAAALEVARNAAAAAHEQKNLSREAWDVLRLNADHIIRKLRLP